jgi:hypothetical protein
MLIESQLGLYVSCNPVIVALNINGSFNSGLLKENLILIKTVP